MYRLRILITFLVFCSLLRGQIIFSEIMFDPAANEYHDEFIEVFNQSYTDSLDLSGWTFSDSSGADFLIPYSGHSKIGPWSFGLILDGSYRGNSTTYDSLIPPGITVLTIDDNAFGSSGLSNSKSEYLSLIDTSGDTVCTYRYSIGNEAGYSDEKIDLDGNNAADNWRDGLVLNGTPGFINSVSPRNVDPGLANPAIRFPNLLFEGDDAEVDVHIKNFGKNSVNGSAGLRLFADRNGNLNVDAPDLLIADTSFTISLPHQFDSSIVVLNWQNIPAGKHTVVTQLLFENDEQLENNSRVQEIDVLCRECALIINEIKFLTAVDEPEWVEIYNAGDRPVYLQDWALSDGIDTAKIDSGLLLSPGKYLVLAEDTLLTYPGLVDSQVVILTDFPTLNNSGDDLYLFEPAGNWVEYVHYDSDWLHGEADRKVSLERLHPALSAEQADNWGPCVDQAGATPGRQNSLYAGSLPHRGKINVQPNPFSPDNDGFEDAALISGEIPEAGATVRCRIYDIRGRLRRTLTENQFSGHRFQLVWNGKDDNGRICRMGIYIVFLQALNNSSATLLEMKKTVVLAHSL